MKTPYFSIVIPTYNRAHSILKGIKSILSQSFQDFEIIIIDDASKDNTEEVVQEIKDKRVRYFRNEDNLERCHSRNKGIELATGKYICFLDSDDYHLPNHLEILYTSIQAKNEPEAFFFVNAWDETEDGERSERLCPLVEALETNLYTYFLRYTVNPQRWCVHREIFEKVKFDPEVIICEDMDTSLRIAAKDFPIYQIAERSTVYVATSDSFTHGDARKWEKELFYLKRIFAKKELKGKLPVKDQHRLLSMCYFHLSRKTFEKKQRLKTIIYSFKSFFLCYNGYNGKTNKILINNFIKSFYPFLNSHDKKTSAK